MIRVVKGFLRSIKKYISKDLLIESEKQKLMLGRLLSNQVKNMKHIERLSEVEFSVFSQWGDDGIIQWLVNNLEIPNKTFIEFGVEDYTESNTRFLLMNDNWAGLVMDASDKNIRSIKSSYYYWKYDLVAKTAFVTKDNINSLIAEHNFERDLGLLHIDIDGNDYYIWEAIEVVNPIIVIIEYNSEFGWERPISVPYDEKFNRTKAHYSNLFFGCSLNSLYHLAQSKGYAFTGCDSAGCNAYFVRRDKLNGVVREIGLEEGFVKSKFRQSRDKRGNLTFLSYEEARDLLKGMIVYNTILKKEEFF